MDLENIKSAGEKIRILRQSAGLTQKQLSDKTHISLSAIGKYEIGERIPKYDTLLKIADALNVPITHLLDLDSNLTIGKSIKYHRINNKLTLEILASKINKSLKVLQKYESDEVTPSIEILNKIEDALNIKHGTILGRTQKFIDAFFDGDGINKEFSKMKKAENMDKVQRYYIDQYLHTLGYKINSEMENGYLILESENESFEIDESDIIDLKNSTKSFIEFKISEIIKKSRKIEK